MVDDIWIEEGVPSRIKFVYFFYNNKVLIKFLSLIIISLIASLIAGLIAFKELRKKPFKLVLLGLSNCFSIVFLILLLCFLKTKHLNEEIPQILSEIKSKKYFRRKITILFKIFTFLIALFILSFLFFVGFIGMDILSIVLFFVLDILLFFLAFSFGKIKDEDKHLFEELKSLGYSSWFFVPKDKMKLVFIILFSFLFLAISLLVLYLLSLVA